MARATGLPQVIARRTVRVVRPRDLADVYSNPWEEAARLTERGLLYRLARGYFAIIPGDRVGDASWRPAIEAVALGIGQADYGIDHAVLTGPSAARNHMLIPRAIALAYVAVPKQRPVIRAVRGRVQFVKRAVDRLDVQRVETELGSGWVTTLEQTVLDLLARRDRYGFPDFEIIAMLRAARPRVDIQLLAELAARAGSRTAIARFDEAVAG